MAVWSEEEAAARFGELLDEATRSGPQVVNRDGKSNVVVLDLDAFQALARADGRFKDLLAAMPRMNDGRVK